MESSRDEGSPFKSFANRALVSTLSFSSYYAETGKICNICAKFHIRGRPYVPSGESLYCSVVSEHKINHEYEDMYPTFPDMSKRASDGCIFCTFMKSTLLSEYQKPARYKECVEEPVRVVLSAFMDEQDFDESALSMYKSKEPHTICVTVLHRDDEEVIYLRCNVSLQFSSEATLTERDPLSPDSLQNITQWLHECDQNHPSCSATSTGMRPTRLVAVKNGQLRIVTGELQYHRYAALSYCWGQLPPKYKSFLTTKSNLGARMSGFQMKELPRTLKDAVKAIRALGIDYIWIDALCIVQDDVNDWSREASNMDKIYRHAYLTIAATNSTSSYDGFLHPRQPSCRASLDFTFKGLQVSPPHTFVNETGQMHFRYPFEKSVHTHLSECKWSKRGWTLQERLLSIRILYFTRDVIYYECVSSQKVGTPGFELPTPLKVPLPVANPTYTGRKEDKEDYYSSWYTIVKEYSLRNLTSPKDKLPAMEGLAKAFKDLVDDVYIYGLWESDLHRGLLWHSHSSWPWKLPPSGYRAPTWSWAARDGPVFWDKSTFKPGWTSLIEQAHISTPQKCTHCSHTTSTQLEFVALVAPLKEVLLAYDPLDQELDRFDPDDWDELGTWDEYEGYLGSFALDTDEDMPLSLAYTRMVLIAERKETKNFQAILVRPTDMPNCFKRIGWFIHRETGDETGEENPDAAMEFESIQKVFELQRMSLV